MCICRTRPMAVPRRRCRPRLGTRHGSPPAEFLVLDHLVAVELLGGVAHADPEVARAYSPTCRLGEQRTWTGSRSAANSPIAANDFAPARTAQTATASRPAKEYRTRRGSRGSGTRARVVSRSVRSWGFGPIVGEGGIDGWGFSGSAGGVGTPISVPRVPSVTDATPDTPPRFPRSQAHPPTFPGPWAGHEWEPTIKTDTQSRTVPPVAAWPRHAR